MEKTLVIVESPAKAKSIGKFLGSKYFVKASMGHIRDLPKSQFGVDPDKGFEPKYIAIRGKGDIIKELRTAVKKAGRVLLASDPDREGEAIAWHLQHLLGLDPGQKCRIEFNEITKNAVLSAVKNPRPIDGNRVNAQQARRILDRLVGYNLSPLLWKKVKKGLSAGRVQSVAVRLICDREEEIDSFIQEEYWTLTAMLARGKEAFEARLHRIGDRKADIPSEARVNEIQDDLKGKSFVVARVVRKEKLRQPPAPFITSSLQQEAYRKLNFAARKTMSVAQQLYEGIDLGKDGPSGLITYIRTDSTRVSDTARQEAADFISRRYGKEYLGSGVRPSAAPKGKIQDAHEAVRPTSVDKEPELVKAFLTNDQYRLYRLVWDRFMASQMSPAVIDTTSVDIKAGDYTFRATGSIIKFNGYMRVYTEARDEGPEEEDNRTLPQLAGGDRLEKKALVPKQHFTQPPPRYSDATLIKALEEKGIGRPSTYAPIVETIQKRGYVVKEKKQFYPTELGMVVVNLLKEYFRDIIDVEFTAAMEDKLDNIEEGDIEWVGVLREFYLPFREILTRAEKEIGHVDLADEVTDELCENCSRNLVIKMGRYGKFLACPGFPECRYTRPLLEPTGVKCPQCSGELVLRRSKKGRTFYGCSSYPDCQFTVWDRPSQEKCPDCGGMMVYKKYKGKETLKCSNPDCGTQDKKADTVEKVRKVPAREAGKAGADSKKAPSRAAGKAGADPKKAPSKAAGKAGAAKKTKKVTGSAGGEGPGQKKNGSRIASGR
ncbi:MAG: type I DNA topoisomerase [Actinobacteria bacterium]|nr:type I DNA topoisomerase [Actinomycetota bacterium]